MMKSKELDDFIAYNVIKTANPNIPFEWLKIIDEFISKYKIPFDNGESMEAHVYAYRGTGFNYRPQLDSALVNGYIATFEDSNKYILTKKGIEARKFNSIEDFERTTVPTPKDTNVDCKKFEKRVIKFLKTKPQKFGDISPIANEFINGNVTNKAEVYKHLCYLVSTDILNIKEPSDDPMKMSGDWWGTLPSHNLAAGYKVEELKAQLSAGYEKLSWLDRNPLKAKFLDWGVPAIIGYLLGLATCNVALSNKTAEKPALDTTSLEYTQAKYERATMNDTLHDKNDSVRDIKTSADTIKK